MSDVGITGYGGYIPRLRLSRQSMVRANAWVNPGLAAHGRSERSMCDADEDSVTMAVEAARNCLGERLRGDIGAVYLASTTMPFADRQNSTIVAEALGLGDGVETLDMGHSQRAGTSGLIAALNGAAFGNGRGILIGAADTRRARSASTQELLFGDGAAALTLGTEKVLARFVGAKSIARDFIDHYRAEGFKYDTYFEERWIRDEGFYKMVPPVVANLLAGAGWSAAEVDHFILPCLIKKVREGLAQKMGLNPEGVCDDLSQGCGETGTAHPLLMLAGVLEKAEPGQKILLIGFGQGVDALLFEATENLAGFSPRRSLTQLLGDRIPEDNYQKYLSFKDMAPIEWGLRAESEPRIRPSAAWREHASFNALIGGRCTKCGTVQFPRAHLCLNPDCRAADSLEPIRLAESPAKVASFTVDRLAYAPNPPLLFGMIEFDPGAKFMMQFASCDPEKLEIGLDMEMVYRIKQNDPKSGYRTYFWKAAPLMLNGEGD